MLINWARVQELRDEIGGDGFADVVAMFLDESDAVVAQASSGFSAEALHFLKGAALNLGFAQLAEACTPTTDPQEVARIYAASKADLTAMSA